MSKQTKVCFDMSRNLIDARFSHIKHHSNVSSSNSSWTRLKTNTCGWLDVRVRWLSSVRLSKEDKYFTVPGDSGMPLLSRLSLSQKFDGNRTRDLRLHDDDNFDKFTHVTC